jgi:hypothetical protein
MLVDSLALEQQGQQERRLPQERLLVVWPPWPAWPVDDVLFLVGLLFAAGKQRHWPVAVQWLDLLRQTHLFDLESLAQVPAQQALLPQELLVLFCVFDCHLDKK